MLQEFINANLLSITDDSDLVKLKKSATDIAKILSKSKQKVASYTLASIDPQVLVDNLDIQEMQALIIKNWKTFLTNSKDTPVTYIRAVMFEALTSVSKDIQFANLIWLTGRNVYAHMKLKGAEKKLISEFLLKMGNAVEQKAMTDWLLPSVVEIEELSVNFEISAGAVDKSALQKRLASASGPHNEDNTPSSDNPNPHFPNAGGPWSFEFAPRAAAAIANLVNKALKDQAGELSSYIARIEEVVNTLIGQAQTEILQKNSMLQMRTQLLWWKEASYSPSLKQPYKLQSKGLLQIIVAKDYASFVPLIYPVSADFFLSQAHGELFPDHETKVSIADALSAIDNSKSKLKPVFRESDRADGKVSLLHFITGLIWGKYNIDEVEAKVGIGKSIKITWSELTLWLFHDMQSLKIIELK